MPTWVIGNSGTFYDGFSVAKYVVVIPSTGADVYWTPPVHADAEYDLFSVDPGNPQTVPVTPTGLVVQAYTDGAGAPGDTPSTDNVFTPTAGTYWVLVSTVTPGAWDPAADWGTFNLHSGGSSTASPWPTMTEVLATVATETETDLPLEWSFDVTGAVGTSTWTGDDDDRWQLPLEWSFLIDLDPIDDVEDP